MCVCVCGCSNRDSFLGCIPSRDSATTSGGKKLEFPPHPVSNPSCATYVAPPLTIKLKFRLHCVRRRAPRREQRDTLDPNFSELPCARLLVARNTRGRSASGTVNAQTALNLVLLLASRSEARSGGTAGSVVDVFLRDGGVDARPARLVTHV